MPPTPIIAIVDNDESVLIALDSLLRSSGYTVQAYPSAQAFLESSGPLSTACLISDIQMPGMCGVQMYEQLSAQGIHIPAIFITGNHLAPLQLSANARPPVGYFPKPFKADHLIACIELALESSRSGT